MCLWKQKGRLQELIKFVQLRKGGYLLTIVYEYAPMTLVDSQDRQRRRVYMLCYVRSMIGVFDSAIVGCYLGGVKEDHTGLSLFRASTCS